jgi:ABC-type molybdate transport system permease subunit
VLLGSLSFFLSFFVLIVRSPLIISPSVVGFVLLRSNMNQPTMTKDPLKVPIGPIISRMSKS